METTYYFVIDELPSSPNYKKAVALCRMRIEGDGAYPELWDGQKWIEHRNIIAASGIGGDNPYHKTTEAEAMKFLASHTD